MKKTYATSMPNHIGAFLKASKCFASLGINITRVSYDKAVDSHMLFLDVEGTEEQIRKADKLEKIEKLNQIAKNRGQTLAQMALAWLYNREEITSVLIGASKPEQIIENLAMINNLNFTDEELKQIDSIAL